MTTETQEYERTAAMELRKTINKLARLSAMPMMTEAVRNEALDLVDQMEGIEPPCVHCRGVGKIYSPLDGHGEICTKCDSKDKAVA